MYLHLDHECATLIFDRALDRVNGALKALNSRILRSIYSLVIPQLNEAGMVLPYLSR
jgi:hypothetical protein